LEKVELVEEERTRRIEGEKRRIIDEPVKLKNKVLIVKELGDERWSSF